MMISYLLLMTSLTNYFQTQEYQLKEWIDCKGDCVKNKPHLVIFEENVLVSLITFQPILSLDLYSHFSLFILVCSLSVSIYLGLISLSFSLFIKLSWSVPSHYLSLSLSFSLWHWLCLCLCFFQISQWMLLWRGINIYPRTGVYFSHVWSRGSLALDPLQNKFQLRFLLWAHGELADNVGVNLGLDWPPLARGFQTSCYTHPPDHFVFLPLG